MRRPTARSQYRLVIADGNQAMAMLLASVLRDAGFRQVSLAGGMPQAIGQIQTRRPHALLLDTRLGDGASGLDLARWIRRHDTSPCREAAILVITAHADRPTVTAARDLGADAFLVKPVAQGPLVTKLVEALERPRDFVRTFSYVGPCRRRRRADDPDALGAPARRAADAKADAEAEAADLRASDSGAPSTKGVRPVSHADVAAGADDPGFDLDSF